jgi:hypothetical protein
MNAHTVYGYLSPPFRRRRLRKFAAIIAPVRGERMLDVGGTPAFWEAVDIDAQLTLMNVDAVAPRSNDSGRFTYVQGDGCALPHRDLSFDIVFSNSVIEHVGTWERQQLFAAEARRVGRRLWIQTPAQEFFIEPHLIAPFVHWLPKKFRRPLIRNCTLRGWLDRPSPAAVEAFLADVRLLTFDEMRALFPDCTILRERFFGLTKSYIATRSFS